MNHNQIVCLVRTGSHSYGTNTPTSDLDVRGIFVGSPKSIRTPWFTETEWSDPTQIDTKLYELNKFMQLALDCNPNVVELLWVNPDDIIHDSLEYQYLRLHRRDLLSQKIIATTMGYGKAQLSRMKNHHNMGNNPQPVDPPKQRDYLVPAFYTDLTNQMYKHNFEPTKYADGYQLVRLSSDIFSIHPKEGHSIYHIDSGALNISDVEHKELLPPAIVLVRYNKNLFDQEYDKWVKYWEWKNLKDNKVALLQLLRNEWESRGAPTMSSTIQTKLSPLAEGIKVSGTIPSNCTLKELTDTDIIDLVHSFTRHEVFVTSKIDFKHAMHLVRLMRMAYELVTIGEVMVRRPDAAELLDIRAGKWSYERIVDHSNELEIKIEQARHSSPLREKPQYDLAADIVMKIQDSVWHRIPT